MADNTSFSANHTSIKRITQSVQLANLTGPTLIYIQRDDYTLTPKRFSSTQTRSLLKAVKNRTEESFSLFSNKVKKGGKAGFPLFRTNKIP